MYYVLLSDDTSIDFWHGALRWLFQWKKGGRKRAKCRRVHLGAANWHKQQHSADEDGKYVLRCLIPQIVAFTNESQYGHEIALSLHVMFVSFSQSSSFA